MYDNMYMYNIISFNNNIICIFCMYNIIIKTAIIIWRMKMAANNDEKATMANDNQKKKLICMYVNMYNNNMYNNCVILLDDSQLH